MLHFPGFGFDGLRAMSVIQYAARNATGNAAAMDEYSGRFFRGGSHPSVVLEVPGKMTDDAIVNLQTAYANKYGGIDNAHRVPLVLTNGISAKPVTDHGIVGRQRFVGLAVLHQIADHFEVVVPHLMQHSGQVGLLA